MSKQIELTWKTREGVIVTEECLLCDAEDPMYMIGSNTPLEVIVNEAVGSNVGMLMGEMVMFEDEVGLFGVPPENVIYIKEL